MKVLVIFGSVIAVVLDLILSGLSDNAICIAEELAVL